MDTQKSFKERRSYGKLLSIQIYGATIYFTWIESILKLVQSLFHFAN